LFRNQIISPGCGGDGSRTAHDVATWGVTEVATWLEMLQLSEYAESFTHHDIHGCELLTQDVVTRRNFVSPRLGI
jgi:diacylglycerol kinase (ATP)